MMAMLLHEASHSHLHAGNSAFSLAEIALLALALIAGGVLLRAVRRARLSQLASENSTS